MARQPLPDILAQQPQGKPLTEVFAPQSVDVMGAVLGRTDDSWHRRELDYPVNRIKVGRRMRPLRDVTALAQSMADIGLINRINLLPDGTLIAGRHRLAAAHALGWKTIPAVIMELGELDTELAEIDENLRRTELTVLEQAQHFARRDDILRAKGLRATASSGRNQYTEVGAPGAPTITTADMAEQMNMSERATQERLQIARSIVQEVQDALAEHPVANSTKGLLTISRQDEATQAAIAGLLLNGRAASVTNALGILEAERKAAEVEEVRQSVVKSDEAHSRQQGAELGKCRICKRPLTDPAHAAAGIGPCCAAKQAAGGDGDAGTDETEEEESAAEQTDTTVPVSLRDGYDSDEWYTPPAYIEAARQVMGEIELDPASCALAQTVVKADRYIDKDHDGLRLNWCTPALWLNPPYSNPQAWVQKLIEEFDEERTDAAIILVNNATETRWFQALLRRFPVCFPAARLEFWRHDHENVGARQGQALFLLTRDYNMRDEFFVIFGQFGPVLSA